MVPRPDRRRRERQLAGVLLFATTVSIALVHRYQQGTKPIADGWGDSATFAVALLSILGVHELGHHAVARHHGMRVSLPLFLPAPFFVGTLGAILRIHDRPRSRGALLEMGASGPLLGFVGIAALWALDLWVVGPREASGELLSRPLLWWVLSYPLPGEVPALSADDPIAYAGWVGALVTSLNLLPFGQLDGGHISCALSPARSRTVSLVVSGLLLLMGILWPGWWAWLLAIHALAARQSMGISGKDELLSVRSRLCALAALVAWACCFTPVPW